MPPTTLTRADVPIVRFRAWLLGWGLLLLIVCAGCGGSFFFAPAIQGSGVLKTEQRPVAGFSQIDVSGIAKLEWRAEKSPSLEVIVEDNLLPHLVTEVTGNTLKIYFNTNVNPTKDVMVKAASPGLDGLHGSGATQSLLKGVQSDHFKLDLSGVAQCTISGQADKLTIEATGASKIDAGGLKAQSVQVDLSGASQVNVDAAKSITGSASGAASVRHQGDATTQALKTSGAASVRRK